LWDKRDFPEHSEYRESNLARATAPVMPLLSARAMHGTPVRMLDDFGNLETVGEVAEVYFTPDGQRLSGLGIWRTDNVPGGGELLWLDEAAIKIASTEEIRIAGRESLREFSLAERTAQTPYRLEMLRGYPLGAAREETGAVDCFIEPVIHCVLGCTCGGRPATLLPPTNDKK
jgi:hypothetical protein